MIRVIAFLAVFVCVCQANAQVIWPGSWTSLGYVDLQNDVFAPPASKTGVADYGGNQQLNVVGDADASGAFWAQDTANVYFRIRVNQNPVLGTGDARVWQTYLNTDADDAIDYVIQLDNASDEQVEIANMSGVDSSNWHDLVPNSISTTETSGTGIGTAGTYSQYVPAATTSFPNAYFVDIALPWSLFIERTGLTGPTSVQVGFATSQQHQVTNRDSPDTGSWTGPIEIDAVPEPSSFIALTGISVIGLAVFGWRRRRRKASSP